MQGFSRLNHQIAGGESAQESDAMPGTPSVSAEQPTDVAEDETEEIGVAVPPVDVTQFEAIFTRFQTPLCNYLYRLVGNREQAYDLAQDVFVKVYRALSSGT